MDRIEFAERRFRQILPETSAHWLTYEARAIEVWLRDDVVPCVEEFISLPEFRSQGTWPLRNLTPGSASTQRRAIVAVDSALVAAAEALLRLAEEEPVAKVLVELSPLSEGSVPTQLVLRGEELLKQTLPFQSFKELDPSWNQVRLIASKHWHDLVCAFDFFDPSGGMMLKVPPPPGATEGVFVVSLNPELHPVGDFVTRCMFRRIEVWRKCLEEFRRFCCTARRHTGLPASAAVKAEQRAWEELRAREAELRTLCLTGQAASLRDSCIILIQAYGAFHSSPDLAWLGLPLSLVEQGLAVLRHRILRFKTSEPVERIATALSALRALVVRGGSQRDVLDAAINAGGLVIVRRPRSVHWEGRRLDTDWDKHPKPWEFLQILAAKARQSADVNEADLYAEAVATSTMANRFRRLKAVLPPSLWKWIKPADHRAYRLELERSQIHLFDAE